MSTPNVQMRGVMALVKGSEVLHLEITNALSTLISEYAEFIGAKRQHGSGDDKTWPALCEYLCDLSGGVGGGCGDWRTREPE